MAEKLELFHTHNEIQKRITQMASEIGAKFDEDILVEPGTAMKDKPLFVALLRGGAPFASMLMGEIARQAPDFHPELDYMITSRYPTDQNPIGEAKIVMDISPSTELLNRRVVVIDDVLDMGDTYVKVRDHLLQKFGVSHVYLAVLVEKDVQRTNYTKADWAGFTGDTGWLVGMGMNDNSTAPEAYRWAPDIWRVIPATVINKK